MEGAEDLVVVAVVLGAVIAFLFLKKTFLSPSASKAPSSSEPTSKPLSRTAHQAGQEYWEKYDAKEGWSSSVANNEKVEKMAGGKLGNRPLDTLLPRREYTPKARGWEGVGVLGRDGKAEAETGQDRMEADRSSFVNPDGLTGDRHEGANVDTALSPSVPQSPSPSIPQPSSPPSRSPEALGISLSPQPASDSEPVEEEMQSKDKDGDDGAVVFIDLGVIRSLVAEGFGVLAATRASMQCQTQEECVAWLCEHLEEPDLNQNLTSLETELLGPRQAEALLMLESEEGDGGAEDFEKAGGAEGVQSVNSKLSSEDPLPEPTPEPPTRPAPQTFSPTTPLEPTETPGKPRTQTPNTSHNPSSGHIPVHDTRERLPQEGNAKALSSSSPKPASVSVPKKVSRSEHPRLQGLGVEEQLQEALEINLKWNNWRSSEPEAEKRLQDIIYSEACNYVWGSQGSGREPRTGVEYCQTRWLRSLDLGDVARKVSDAAIMRCVCRILREGCPRPAHVPPPVSVRDLRLVTPVTEVQHLLSQARFLEALSSWLQEQGEASEMNITFSQIVGRLCSEMAEADLCSTEKVVQLCELAGRMMRNPMLRGFWVQAFRGHRAWSAGPGDPSSPEGGRRHEGHGGHGASGGVGGAGDPRSPSPEGPAVYRGSDFLRNGPLSCQPMLLEHDPRSPTLYLGWKTMMDRVKGALYLKDEELRAAFIGYSAEMFRGNFSVTSKDTLLPNLALIWGRLCEPFLAPDSSVHRDMHRFNPIWYRRAGRVDLGGTRRLRGTVERDEAVAQDAGEDGFAVGNEEALALARALRASLSDDVLEDEEEAAIDATGSGAAGQVDQSQSSLSFSFVTESWFLCLQGMNKGFIPAMSALKHWQSEAGKHKEGTKELAEAQAKVQALSMMTQSDQLGDARELMVKVSAMVLVWISKLRRTSASLAQVPEYVLNDALHVLWTTWVESPAVILALPVCSAAIDALPTLIGRGGNLGSSYLRYRIADVVVQLRELDERQGRTSWDSRLNQMEASSTCQDILLPALADIFVDIQDIGAADVHAFDKNPARGRIAYLMLHFLRLDPFASSLRREVHRSAGSRTRIENFLDSVLGDGIFVLKDALGRLVDIKAIQIEKESEAWNSLPEGLRRDRQNLLQQLEGVAVHFLNLSHRNLQLLEILIGDPDICSCFCSDRLKVKFAGFIHSAVRELCGASRNDLKVADKARYGFDPVVLVSKVSLLLAAAAESKEVLQEIPFSGSTENYRRLLRVAREKGNLSERTSIALTGIQRLLEESVEHTNTSNTATNDGPAERQKDWQPNPEQIKEYRQHLEKLAFDQHDMRGSGNGTRYLHSYHREISNSNPNGNTQKVKRLVQELNSLAAAGSLPISPDASIFMRSDESRMDVAKVVLSGPTGTPYSLGLWLFDIFFPDQYPGVPPVVLLQTTGNGLVRFNPNLYSDGKVCLSLLGTWHGEPWNPRGSTLLQVLVSIQGLIMVPEPYYNEPGYELQKGSAEGLRRSRQYNDMIHLNAIRYAMLAHLRNPPPGFEEVVTSHFGTLAGPILQQCNQWENEAVDKEVASEIRSATLELERALGQLKQ